MKTLRFLSALLVCLMAVNICAFSKTNDDEDNNTETIVINNVTNGEELENQRSVYHLDCVLYKSTKSVKVHYSGIGDVNVYIFNSQGNIIAHKSGSDVEGCILLPSLSATGLCRIYIEADAYMGEGYFVIYN